MRGAAELRAVIHLVNGPHRLCSKSIAFIVCVTLCYPHGYFPHSFSCVPAVVLLIFILQGLPGDISMSNTSWSSKNSSDGSGRRIGATEDNTMPVKRVRLEHQGEQVGGHSAAAAASVDFISAMESDRLDNTEEERGGADNAQVTIL